MFDLLLQFFPDVVCLAQEHVLRQDDVHLHQVRRAEVEGPDRVDLHDQRGMIVGQPLEINGQRIEGTECGRLTVIWERKFGSAVCPLRRFTWPGNSDFFLAAHRRATLTVRLSNPGDDDIEGNENGTDGIDEDSSRIDPRAIGIRT